MGGGGLPVLPGISLTDQGGDESSAGLNVTQSDEV